MIISAEHPYTKYFTIWLDGEPIKQYFHYDTDRKVAAVGIEETAKLFTWDLARSLRTRVVIGEEYEIRGGMFVKDVEGDFQLRITQKCPPRIREAIQAWDNKGWENN